MRVKRRPEPLRIWQLRGFIKPWTYSYCDAVTNSRKTMKTIPFLHICVRCWPRNILNPRQCGLTLLYLPPPFTARTGRICLQLALEVRDVKTSDRELLTPSTLPQLSTLATNSANVKAACPNSQSSRMSCGLRGKNDPPHTCSRLQILLDERRA